MERAYKARKIMAVSYTHLDVYKRQHQCRPGAGQIAFRQVRVSAVQIVRRHHAQHRVTQKFQPLIALGTLGLVLVGVRAVGQGVLQQCPIRKAIAQLFRCV